MAFRQVARPKPLRVALNNAFAPWKKNWPSTRTLSACPKPVVVFLARRAPGSAVHSSIPDLAWKPCAARQRKIPGRRLVAMGAGLSAVFLASALIVLSAMGVALLLLGTKIEGASP